MKGNKLTLFDKALISIIPFTVVLAVILFFVTKNEHSEIKSLSIGALTSLVLNFWNVKTLIKISQENYKKIRTFTVFSFFFRYLTMAALILLGWLVYDFNPIYIMFGLLEYPLLLVILSIISNKEIKTNA